MEKKNTNPGNKQPGKGLFSKKKPFAKDPAKTADGTKASVKSSGVSKVSAKSTGSSKATAKSSGSLKSLVKSAGGPKAQAKTAGGAKTPAKSTGGAKPAPKTATRPNIPAEWLYMTPQEVTVRNLLEALKPEEYPDVEIWEAAGVLEITLGEKSSFDIETVDPPVMEDDFSNAYLKEHEIKSLFMVTIKPESFEEAQKAMHQIINTCGGFFCGDTDNFMPVVK